MLRRSWKAAGALVAIAWLVGLSPISPWAEAGETPALVNRVRLSLNIAGLGPDGYDLEVKPAHAGCQFKPITLRYRAGTSGKILLPPDATPPLEVRTTSPDRDCTFAITIREPGLPPQTFMRGFRLAAPTPGAPAIAERRETFYLSAPTQIAAEAASRRKG